MSKNENEKSIAEIWAMFRETDKRFKETDEKFKETDEKFKETGEKFKETDKQIKELGKQIGGLGKKFGGFTEGMAFPSMRRILMEKFNMNVVSPRVISRRNGEMMELDVLAYADGQVNAVYVVEVKSRLRIEDLSDILEHLNRFTEFFPEHRNKSLYGIVAAVDVTEQVKKKVLDAGLYLALIRDDTFMLDVPEGFQPKKFN
jgi:hypothetical protein